MAGGAGHSPGAYRTVRVPCSVSFSSTGDGIFKVGVEMLSKPYHSRDLLDAIEKALTSDL